MKIWRMPQEYRDAKNKAAAEAHRHRMDTDPEYAEKYRRYKRNLTLLRNHGIDLEDFEKLSARQEHKCGICGREVPLVVDHCHESERIRGLLCSNCNAGIGLIGEANLEAAVRWVWK